MRRSFSLAAILFCGSLLILNPLPAKASSFPKPPEIAWQQLKLSEFVNLKPADFSRLTGHRLNILQRLSFGMLKQQMKKKLRRNEDQTVGEFMATYRRPYKWWYIVLIIGLAIILVIAVVSVSKLSS